MSSRANFVLIENRQVQLYYSTYALSTPAILAQGLEFCESLFKKHICCEYLLDNAWAEGGILIDKDNKLVLMFGGEEIAPFPAAQRQYVQYMMETSWQGWNVKYCFQGNIDIAQYLGMMDNRLLADGMLPDFFEIDQWTYEYLNVEEPYGVITIINNGYIADYALNWLGNGIYKGIASGPNLKDVIPKEMRLEKWYNEIYTSQCLLIDYDSRCLYVCWGGHSDHRALEEVARIWKGWEVDRQYDGLRFHFLYTGRDPSVIECTMDKFLAYWVAGGTDKLPEKLKS